jgi:antitoxin (DNA-binding transcriptional repressor) of toxin-antitoxin stability system
MHTVTVDEAKDRLPELIDEVLRGGQVVILKGRDPAIQLVPLTRPGFGSLKGQIVMADDFDAPLTDLFSEYVP